MRCSCLCRVVVLDVLVAPAAAQAPPEVPYATQLPVPDIDENAPPAAFLDAARHAIAAGRNGEAMEALERAESRALIRSVRPSLVDRPSRQPLVDRIAEARAALAGGDRMRTLELIDQALATEAGEPQ
jgi:hypothetical protein